MSSSPPLSIVLTPSFSKMIGMPFSLSFRIFSKASTVFLANLLTDLVRTKSIFPARHASIIALKSSRLFVCVADLPSSANMPAHFQLRLLFILLVSNLPELRNFLPVAQARYLLDSRRLHARFFFYSKLFIIFHLWRYNCHVLFLYSHYTLPFVYFLKFHKLSAH